MKKEDVRTWLQVGKKLFDLFDFTDGQDCLMFKSEFELSDEVSYIPDVSLNEIPIDRELTEEEIEYVIEKMYTGNDFLEECKNNVKLAIDLFSYCDWQHPSSALADYAASADFEMVEICGQTYGQLFGETEQFTDDELYIISDAILNLIRTTNKAIKLTYDSAAIEVLQKTLAKYQTLNTKICGMLE